ncbi:putative Na+/H+ antiporter [Ramlibacter sp.]|uniref:putative Na+/H+ antiporter n=1 Tax=Ramlibacter sp. TaxID=1917967 RepID=UPI002BBC3D91|nr:putative Na+/H+ antiporter [Ramlibacter sp.]HWI83809.1 putative Na+/H+ antiporter [Ramlibacter sp.]
MSSTVQWVAAAIFATAILHTFSTKFFERLAHERPQHAGMWHLLGEVEVVFGFWAMVLVLVTAALLGTHSATAYLDSRDYTEPMFVFAIMVVAGSRAILHLSRSTVMLVDRFTPMQGPAGLHFVTLSLVPLMGSLITEPAAMTLAALMLREQLYRHRVSNRLKYATLGVLFVNISIGGTLTPFAAPPVLMVAGKWNWDLWHMVSQIGWKSALAVTVNALALAFAFRRELETLPRPREDLQDRLPRWVLVAHALFLAGIVAFAHHPPVFLGLLLFFLGFAMAYPQFQDRLMLREGLLVAFFLAGLVVLGGQQQWWLEPLLRGMDSATVYYGATALTAVTDNAALTFLASTVEGLSDEFKYSVVTGAVTGGGLTVIANAPNPAGFSILRGHFRDGAIHPLGLFAAALLPTLVAVLAYRLL